jgi:two-component system OmpR family sensor kinase
MNAPLARPPSLKRRLSLGLAAGVTLLWLAGTLCAALVLRHEIDEVFDSALQEVAQRILPLAYSETLNADKRTPEAGVVQKLPAVQPHREYITYIVRDADGRILLQSHDADPKAFPTSMKPGFRDEAGFRFYTEVAVQGALVVTAAEAIDHRRQAVVEAVSMLLWPLLLLLPLGALGVVALVRYSLRPLAAFQAELEARGRGDLSPVDTGALPSELDPFATSVNRLIVRLRRALEAERGFTASSAHELRTPIAAALAQTQRLVTELPDGPAHRRARAVEEALRQLSRLSDKLLQLAKAEGGGFLAEAPHDAVQVLELVLDEFGRMPEVRARLDVVLPPRGAIRTRIDADALAILARNLVENALSHGPADGGVSVVLTPGGRLTVTNGGPAIAPEELTRLRRPFERGATTAAGSGLGLVIAAAIAESAGERLELRSPATGRADGFEASLQLPMSLAAP